MPELTHMQKPLDAADKGLEEVTVSPPDWARGHLSPTGNETDAKGIPKDFFGAILEVIAKSIEQALAEIIVRCVGKGVETGMRPLTQFFGLSSLT